VPAGSTFGKIQPMSGGLLTVLIAPDSFKGSISSIDVARALADGWRRARPDDQVLLSPLADGGEGTLAAVAASDGWEWHTAEVSDPLFRHVQARWLSSPDHRFACIEMAEASGLSRVAAAERDALKATSYGTGELIEAAVTAGARRIILGIGGSATTDGGYGLLNGAGLAMAFTRTDGSSLTPSGAGLADVGEVQLMHPRDQAAHPAGLSPYEDVDLEVACDVTNPLLGPTGAAATYGPQKGASASDVEFLDAALRRWADALERLTGRAERDTPGAGAAGGVGFALLAIQDRFRSFALRPGVELVMEATGFHDKLAHADVVMTGEGRIDEQTAFGKTALGVARRAHAAGKPTIAVGGGVTPEGIAALAPLGAVVVPVVEHPQTVEEAMASGAEPLLRCGERIARLISLGAIHA
jgi:glycerate kinase